MYRSIRALGLALAAGALVFFALLGSARAAPLAAETKTVSVIDFDFAPDALTITVGDTVTWRNDGQRPHTATANDGSFDSGNLNSGQEFSRTFDTAGTFAYVCRYHDTMQATLTVQPAGAAQQPTAQPPAAEQPAAAAPTGSVAASDQPVVGGAITVASVTAGQDGWIVAHLDENGAPGKVLGQTAVKAGENANVKIQLSESVAVGARLWPMLHIDAGAAGVYEFPGADVPVRDAGGMVVMKQIAVTAAAADAPTGPAQLPTTGATGPGAVLLAFALALLALGSLALARARRRW